MSQGRPEILFPLFAELTGLPGIGPKTEKLLNRIGVQRPVDLLLTLPTGVEDRRLRETLSGIVPGETVTVLAEIREHRAGRGNAPYRVIAVAKGGTLELIYFRPRGQYLEKLLPIGGRRIISGRVELYDGRWQMPHPDLVLDEQEADKLQPWEPIYPLTQDLTRRVVARAVEAAIERMPELPEWIGNSVLTSRKWPGWAEAIRAAHAPEGREALCPANPARQRLAYDELLSHQLALQLVRARMKRQRGRPNASNGAMREKALAAFGHPLTGAQTRAIAEITADMAGDNRRKRLLPGDVGAGKTMVALMAMLAAVEAGGQAAMMAPTELLARQHAAGIAPLARAAGVEVALLTGRAKGAGRAETLTAIRGAQAQIIIGTHALFQRDVAFADLRLVIIDEQHRFGVRQRIELAGKAPKAADMLVMTATPIPRTLALAGFGDLDISVLDEKPEGRQPVESRLVSMERYEEVVARLGHAIAIG